MGIATEPPDVDTYNFVLVKKDLNAEPGSAAPIRVVTYSENVISRSIEWRGEYVHMIFVTQKESAKRAWRFGWEDITEEWKAHLQSESRKPTTPSQEAILSALTHEWQTKAEIIAASGIKDTEWRTSMRYLLEKGLAESNATRKTTNRGHRYRLPMEN